jgi:hypothetical protein
MKFKRPRSLRQFFWLAIRIVGIAIGLYGGLLAAGMLNSHRSDLPVRILSTQPAATQPAK